MSDGIPRIVAFGEAMLELSRDGSAWRLAYGGDTLNFTVHCARLGLSAACLTALGCDPLSEGMCDQWRSEGIDTSLVLIDESRPTGLYAISTSTGGERSFTYWRQGSAASALFAQPGFDVAAEHCLAANLFFFSLISLAILPEDDRFRLLALAARVRAAGGLVAFDGNYRPSLWADAETARRWRNAGAAVSDIGLPSLDDERVLDGLSTAAEVASLWRAAGAKEVVVKLGASGCHLDEGQNIAPTHCVDAVDTSGAGDAFDAAYLSARLRGQPPRTAGARANRLAAWVVARKGAIPPIDTLAPYHALGHSTDS